MRFQLRRLTPSYYLASLLALVGAALLRHGPGVHEASLIKGAAKIGDRAQHLGPFIDTCNALINPALVAAGAATPLAVIGGGVAMAFGARRGMSIVITALATLALLGSVKGIVS